jgi:hypothetical protein
LRFLTSVAVGYASELSGGASVEVVKTHTDTPHGISCKLINIGYFVGIAFFLDCAVLSSISAVVDYIAKIRFFQLITTKCLALMKVGKSIKIPKRTFIGTSPEVERLVRTIIEDNLSEYFNNEFKLKE